MSGSVSSEVIFDIEVKRDRLAELERRMAEPGFWDDPAAAREVVKDASALKDWIEPWDDARTRSQELLGFGELLEAEDDPELREQWTAQIHGLERDIERIELNGMLNGPDDSRDALITIHPGAGGTESQDWAEMLMRMYNRWSERHEYSVQVLDIVAAEDAGIKSATLEVRGRYAYGYLKAEKGVHRLVRISPYDAQSRRHTSFASVFVYPVVEDDVAVEIEEKDLRIDTFRAGGKGGQHVNKTDSAVRITHEPTGIVVSCQNERSQHQNKATAMKMLRAALYEHEMEKRREEREKVEAEKTDIAWGNQIRSYVLQPYTMVTDHRTDLKLSGVDGVLDGDLDPFIETYLKQNGAPAV